MTFFSFPVLDVRFRNDAICAHGLPQYVAICERKSAIFVAGAVAVGPTEGSWQLVPLGNRLLMMDSHMLMMDHGLKLAKQRLIMVAGMQASNEDT